MKILHKSLHSIKLIFHPNGNFLSMKFCNALVLRLQLEMNLVALWHLLSLLGIKLSALRLKTAGYRVTIAGSRLLLLSLNEILECQVIDKYKKGLGYDAANAVSPAVEGFVNLTDKSRSDKAYHVVTPHLFRNFLPSKPDLTFIDEIVESENFDVTTIVTPSNEKTVENKDGKKKTVFPTISKIEFVGPKQPEKPVRKPVKYAEMYKSQKLRGNQRN
ncbi:hypothetical protein Tco_0432596 [Tanacetum coccineum]